jgi:hypothetical protein
MERREQATLCAEPLVPVGQISRKGPASVLACRDERPMFAGLRE